MPTAQNSVLVNHKLQKLGFGTLKDPTLFDQMAAVIRDHTHFRRLLMAVEQGQRHVAYQALAAKLRFKAKPLEDYEIESRTLAEQNQLPHYDPKSLAVTEWKPQEIETQAYKARKCACGMTFNPTAGELECGDCRIARDKLAKIAAEAIDRDLREAEATQQLTLCCRVCTYEQKFRVKKRSAAYKIARSYGWMIEHKGTTALCRACKPKDSLN